MKRVLILIDVQNEYVMENRPFKLNGIEPSLSQCKTLLAYARANAWEVIHIQHSNEGRAGIDRFLPGTTYFDFIEGFHPKQGERHYIKNDFSCYSNEAFSAYINQLQTIKPSLEMYIAGYNSVMCCLSTLEEARRRNHAFHFVHDASLAKALDELNEASMHAVMMKLYHQKNLAKLVLTSEVTNDN